MTRLNRELYKALIEVGIEIEKAEKVAEIVAKRVVAGTRPSAEYRTWVGMKDRCCNPASKHYPSYGGRGIKICPTWLYSFDTFLKDVGYKPSPHHSLDRYPDNNGNYCAENVRWATKAEQTSNRRNSRLITYQGITTTPRGWEERTGIPRQTIINRVFRYGIPVEKALTHPAMSQEEFRAHQSGRKGVKFDKVIV